MRAAGNVLAILATTLGLATNAAAEEAARPQPPALIATDAPAAGATPAATPAETAASTETAAPEPPAAPRLVASPRCAGKIGTSRVHVLDTTGGPHFGRINRYDGQPFLGPKEVLFTFDDGPNPRATGRVLDVLNEHCVKATFFVVGTMSRYHTGLLKRVVAEGHTIAGHTYSHAMPFGKQPYQKAVLDIEKGYQTLLDLGVTPAPIFRFPGLSDTPALRTYLSARNISALSVDIVSGDTNRGASVESVIRNTMRSAERNNGGIILMHDPLKRSAAALPEILRQLHAGGYKVVHLTTKHDFAPVGAARMQAAAAQVAAIETATIERAEMAMVDDDAVAPTQPSTLGGDIATESIPGPAAGLPRGVLRLVPIVAPESPQTPAAPAGEPAPSRASGAAPASSTGGLSPVY